MQGLKPFLCLLVGVLVCAILIGCAGSVPPNGPGALNIAEFTLSQGVVGVAYKQLLIASGGLQPYTWTISVGALPPGLSLTSDGIIQGTPTTTGTFHFTAKVTDSQTPTAAYNTLVTSIQINAPLSLASSTLVSGFVNVSYQTTLTAQNGVEPYTYALAPNSMPLPPGLTLSTNVPQPNQPNSGSITGTPTTAGVYNFTVQATDALSEVVTGQFTITITGQLQGGYAITFNGFDTSQPAGSQAFYLVGSIVADGNGNITSGVIDQNGPGSTIASAVSITGTYSLPGGSNLGTLSFTRSDNNATYQFDIVVSTVADSRIIMADSTHPQMYGSGLVKRQTTTTIASGGANYTFGWFGNDTSAARYAGAGTFALSSSLAITGGEEDTNDNGTVAGPVPITGGTVSSPNSSTGRGTLSLTTASGTTNYAYYVASPTELVAVETDASGPQTLADIVQQSSAGITGGTLILCKSGSSCQGVVAMNGQTSGGSPVPIGALGTVTFNGSGGIQRTDGLPAYYTDQTVGGTYTPVSYTQGTYTIDSSGRVSVTLQGASSQPVWYLSGTTQGVVLGTDSTVMSGTLQPQNGAPFSLASLLGSYLGGTLTPVLPSITNELDVASTPPPGGIFALSYQTSGPAGPSLVADVNLTYALDPTYGAGLGRFAVCGANAQYCTSFSYDPNNPPVEILYVVGGTAGATGGKTGLVGLDLGVLNPSGNAQIQPNPRITSFGK